MEDEALTVGQVSQRLRLIRTEYTENQWGMTVEGLPEKLYPLLFFTGDKPIDVQGGRVLTRSLDHVRVALQSTPQAVPTKTDYVQWPVIIRW